jgi:hypothetical protein
MLGQGRGVNNFNTANRLAAELPEVAPYVRDREGSMSGASQSQGRIVDPLNETARLAPLQDITVGTEVTGVSTPCVFEFFHEFRKGNGTIIEIGGEGGGLLVATRASDEVLIARCGNGSVPPESRSARVVIPLEELPGKGWVTVECSYPSSFARIRIWVNRELIRDVTAATTNAASGWTGANPGRYYELNGFFPIESPQPAATHTDPGASILRIFDNQTVP